MSGFSFELEYVACARSILREKVAERENGNPVRVVETLRRIERESPKALLRLAAKMEREQWEQEWGLVQ